MKPTDPAEPQSLTIVRLEVDSYKRMKAAHVIPSPTGLVPVRGKNAQGKSSLIESMMAALGGQRGSKSELPIAQGAHGAEVVVDLGDLIVTRTWTRDSGGKAKSTLVVRDATTGRKKSGPQQVLDKLVGKFADPVAFLSLPADKQVKVTLDVLGLGGELAPLEQDAQEWYDERTECGRDVYRLGKALHEIKIEVDGLPDPPEDKTISEITSELQTATAHNQTLWNYAAARTDAVQRGNESKERLERLTQEVAILEAEIQTQRDRWTEANEALGAASDVDLEPIKVRLAAQEEAGKHAGRHELLNEIQTQHTHAQVLHKRTEDGLAKARAGIAELLGETQFPIPGMAYDHEAKSLTVGGIPFSQASQAERLKVAAAVAMAGSPVIKVLFAREGSLLDELSQRQLACIAEEAGWQFWLEIVDSDADGAGVYIEDGQAFQADVEEVPAE